MNKLTSVQAEKLIELIKEKPFIYNKADKHYKHFSMKEVIWKEIAENVGVDANDCKVAWKSLRDQFVKATKKIKGKSGQEFTEYKTYKYYEQLLFLKDSLETRKRPRNYDHWTDESETMDSDVTAILNVAKKESAVIDDEFDPIDVMNEIVAPSTSANNRTSTPTSRSSPGPSKRLKNNSKEDNCLQEFLTGVLSHIKSLNSKSQGENEQFFSSLSIMIDKANLSTVQTRQIHRKLFNFVCEELDKIESNK